MFSFFKKDNIHEINFKAQFANFRKKYEKEIRAVGMDEFGKEFGQVIDESEKKVMNTIKNPKNVPENIDYWNVTVNQVLLDLLDKVIYGRYIYRGMPAYETAYFVKMYKRLVEDAYNSGMCNAEERQNALENLADEIRNNG